MGIISGIATLMLPFINVTIAFCAAFVVSIWFTLTIIYGIIEIINLLLGQPLVGWLITGDINATNDIRNLFSSNMFSFTSPIMMFLYVALAISLFMFLVYFIFQMFQFKTLDNFSVSSTILSFSLIILSVIWIPFLYSLLVLVSASLMIGITSLLSLAKINSSESYNFDVNTLKNNLIENLQKLKSLKAQGRFLYVDLENPKIQEWTKNHLNAQEIVSFQTLVENWNNFLTDNNLPMNKFNNWIDTLNSINYHDFSQLTFDQKSVLAELGAFSQCLNLLNHCYDDIFHKILILEELREFNGWFISSSSINLEEFRLNIQVFDLNLLDREFTIENFAFYVLHNQVIYSNKFSQNLVNILYSLALGKNSVFIPGWSDNVIEQSWNLFWIIPTEMKLLGLNFTAYLFYNLKVILIGSIINSILITSIIIFAFTLLRRFVYIAIWPIYALFLLANAGAKGDFSIVRSGINDLFYKFVNILVFGLLWNFICLLTTSIFAALDQIDAKEFFGSEAWIMDIFKLFVVIGIIIDGFAIIGDIIQKLSEEKTSASSGASEIAKASSKASKDTSHIKNKASQSVKRTSKSIGRRWERGGRDAWVNTKGQGFKARTTTTAKAMFNYRAGGKK